MSSTPSSPLSGTPRLSPSAASIPSRTAALSRSTSCPSFASYVYTDSEGEETVHSYMPLSAGDDAAVAPHPEPQNLTPDPEVQSFIELMREKEAEIKELKKRPLVGLASEDGYYVTGDVTGLRWAFVLAAQILFSDKQFGAFCSAIEPIPLVGRFECTEGSAMVVMDVIEKYVEENPSLEVKLRGVRHVLQTANWAALAIYGCADVATLATPSAANFAGWVGNISSCIMGALYSVFAVEFGNKIRNGYAFQSMLDHGDSTAILKEAADFTKTEVSPQVKQMRQYLRDMAPDKLKGLHTELKGATDERIEQIKAELKTRGLDRTAFSSKYISLHWRVMISLLVGLVTVAISLYIFKLWVQDHSLQNLSNGWAYASTAMWFAFNLIAFVGVDGPEAVKTITRKDAFVVGKTDKLRAWGRLAMTIISLVAFAVLSHYFAGSSATNIGLTAGCIGLVGVLNIPLCIALLRKIYQSDKEMKEKIAKAVAEMEALTLKVQEAQGLPQTAS